MKRKVDIKNYNNGAYYNINVNIPLPDKCPICSTAYGDIPIITHRYCHNKTKYGYGNTISIYYCPYCEHYFVVYYTIYDRGCDGYEAFFDSTYPIFKNKTKFGDEIVELSPNFVEIYRQSETAEGQGLNEICGIGYRKSLEFLVKDYACRMHIDETEKIKNMQLGSCINNYIDNKKIKTLALASAWLGNDETHYVRKHENYNISDLKLFIKSILTYIESELVICKAEELIKSNN